MQSDGHGHERTTESVVIRISVIKTRMPFICLENENSFCKKNIFFRNA